MNRPTDAQMREQMQKAHEQLKTRESLWDELSYEDGVELTLKWVLEGNGSPMDDEDDPGDMVCKAHNKEGCIECWREEIGGDAGDNPG